MICSVRTRQRFIVLCFSTEPIFTMFSFGAEQIDLSSTYIWNLFLNLVPKWPVASLQRLCINNCILVWGPDPFKNHQRVKEFFSLPPHSRYSIINHVHNIWEGLYLTFELMLSMDFNNSVSKKGEFTTRFPVRKTYERSEIYSCPTWSKIRTGSENQTQGKYFFQQKMCRRDIFSSITTLTRM